MLKISINLKLLILFLILIILGAVYSFRWSWWPYEFTHPTIITGKYSTVGDNRNWIIRNVQPLIYKIYKKNGAYFMEGIIKVKNEQKRVLITFYLGRPEEKIDLILDNGTVGNTSWAEGLKIFDKNSQINLEYLSSFPLSQLQNCQYGILCQIAIKLQKMDPKFTSVILENDYAKLTGKSIPVISISSKLINE